MDKNRKHDIALMKYRAIAPVISGLDESHTSYAAFFRDVSAAGICADDGTVRHYAAGTIKKWYFEYMHGGFDALMPKGRADQGKPRKLDNELMEQIRNIKSRYPKISASGIYRQLQDDAGVRPNEISLSTVNRFVNQIAHESPEERKEDMRRYEREHINEVWCGDSCTGPYLKTEDGRKHRVYITALIDDASRFITGIDIFFNDSYVNLMSVLKSAVAKFGVPKVYNFDNGSSFRNRQMELLAARTGSVIHYDRPYTPVQKAKIERWFKTLRVQWMAGLDMNDFRSLEELRGSLISYVNRYNRTLHSSLKGLSPQDRFFSESQLIRRLDDEKLESCFMLEIERRVSADSVISIDCVEYEVPCRFAGMRITLRYSPDMENIYVLEADDSLTPVRLLDKVQNSRVKREKVHLCGEEE